MLFDFDAFFIDFDKDFYRFNRNLKDMYPYEIIKKDDKVTVVHNVLGLGKDDIEITAKRDKNNDYLVISGEKKNEVTDRVYNVDSRFAINLDEIKEVEYEVKDGLLYIYITYKEPEKPKLNIKYRG